MAPELPPCGLYRTTQPIGDVPPGRLVYFHNHGNPGPAVYLPDRWTANRAHFAPTGTAIPSPFDPRALAPLPREGFYRVTAAFHCCAKRCTELEPDMFVQLGYNGAGHALVFVPQLGGGSIAIPERGVLVDDAVLGNLAALRVYERAEPKDDLAVPRGIIIH